MKPASWKDSYIRDMGLRYFDSVLCLRDNLGPAKLIVGLLQKAEKWWKWLKYLLHTLPRIVTAGRFTSIDEVLRTELEDCGVPWLQTYIA